MTLRKIFVLSLLAVLSIQPVHSQFVTKGIKRNRGDGRLNKTQTIDMYEPILINNIMNYYGNDGDGSLNPVSQDGEGFEFPKGSGGDLVDEDGLVWSGLQNGVVKFGGSTYWHGLQAGKIVTPGTPTNPPVPDNPSLPKYRIYRVRPDINPRTSFDSVQALIDSTELPLRSRYGKITDQQIYDQYIADWNEWPANDGAPFQDVNGDGRYDPGVDIPGVPHANQTLWHVSNDLDSNRAHLFSGGKPMGLEFQRTIWAYSGSGLPPANNTIFVSVKLINKSAFLIDSMYIGYWVDSDIGGSSGYFDDFVGCDTVLNMGFGYNATGNDGFYGSKPPAVGYVLLQGPLVQGAQGDSGMSQHTVRPGFRNLGLTAFKRLINGALYDNLLLEPNPGPTFASNWFQTLKGEFCTIPNFCVDPTTGQETSFQCAGDPETGAGWIDGLDVPAGDRMFVTSSGPFPIAPGDTEEVVYAVVAAQGLNRLQSVALLKSSETLVRAAYDRGTLSFPASAPLAAHVTATGLDREVILDWSDPVQSSRIENLNSSGYRFEGYNVYQLPGPSFSNPKFLAEFDVKDNILDAKDYVYDPLTGTYVKGIIFLGTDNGIRRTIDIKFDSLGRNWPLLINGNTYYYAVKAFYYNPDPNAVPASFQSAPVVVAVKPQMPNPGTELRSQSGQSLTGVVKQGDNAGSIAVSVVDPTKITGDTYKITFDSLNGRLVWNLADSTRGTILLSHYSQFGVSGDNPIVDGIQIGVVNPDTAFAFKTVLLVNDGQNDFSSHPQVWSAYGGVAPTGQWGLAYLGRNSSIKVLAGSATGRDDYEMRFTALQGGSEYYLTGSRVVPGTPSAPDRLPFDIWDISINRRLVPSIRDSIGMGRYSVDTSFAVGSLFGVLHRTWESISAQDPASLGFYTEPLPNPAILSSAGLVIQNLVIADSCSTSSAPFQVPSGAVLRLVTKKPVLPGDSFTFSTDSLSPITNNLAFAKQEVNAINVYPNPYFGFNNQETDRYHHFVTISHLPQKAVVRIFSLAGSLVRTIVKDDPGQFLQWDLTNDNGFGVVPAMYVIDISMPDLGRTKILKIAILPESQIPPVAH